MKIRSGTYTEYRGLTLKVNPSRYETPIEDKNKQYILHYDGDDKCPIEGFKKSEHEHGMVKIIPNIELTNSYFVQTYGTLANFKFQLTQFQPNPKIVNIETNDEQAYKALKLTKVFDQNGLPLYIDQIPISKFENIWEERKPAYHLQMPAGLEPIHKIQINT